MAFSCTVCVADSKVTNTRYKDVHVARRRRECLKCGFRFTTYEVPKEHYVDGIWMFDLDNFFYGVPGKEGGK